MREILFKAMNVRKTKWFFGYPVLFVDRPKSILTNMGEIDINPKTVCQFTGKFDHNKERIFEGDYLKYDGPCKTRAENINRAISTDSVPVVFSYEYGGGWVIEKDGRHLNIGTRSEHFIRTGRNIHDEDEK